MTGQPGPLAPAVDLAGFVPSPEDLRQVALIHRLLQIAPFPLWLSGGWGLDARLGRVTRSHEDIDLAIPAEHMDDFLGMLRSEGADAPEWNDYGFLTRICGILIDCEPCDLRDGAYELDGVPSGSCPAVAEGVLAGIPVWCTSLQAMAWDYFHYLREVPFQAWPEKDLQGLERLRLTAGAGSLERWQEEFDLMIPRD